VIRPSAKASTNRSSPNQTWVRLLEVGIEHHVDLEPRVGQGEIDLVDIDDDPVVAVLGRRRRKGHLNDDAAILERPGSQGAADVPEQ
jgi:hypothetical protein